MGVNDGAKVLVFGLLSRSNIITTKQLEQNASRSPLCFFLVLYDWLKDIFNIVEVLYTYNMYLVYSQVSVADQDVTICTASVSSFCQTPREEEDAFCPVLAIDKKNVDNSEVASSMHRITFSILPLRPPAYPWAIFY